MAETNRDVFQLSNPNNGWAHINRLGGLASLFESMLPLAARSYNHKDLEVGLETADTLVPDFAGEVLAVEATEGTVTGVFTLVAGAPATTEAQLSYDSEGVPTLLFNAGDAVTKCQLKANSIAADAKAYLDAPAG